MISSPATIAIALLSIALITAWMLWQKRRRDRIIEASRASQATHALVLAQQEALNALMDDSSLGVDELQQRTAAVLAGMEALDGMSGFNLKPLIEDNRKGIAEEFGRRRAREAGSASAE